MFPWKKRRLKLLLLLGCYYYYRKQIKFHSYIRKRSLNPVKKSQWAKQKQTQDELTYFCTCGVSIDGFNYLHTMFSSHSYFSKHRPRGIGSYNMLGLVLQFMRTTGQQFQLQQIFGYSAASVSRNLHIGMKILLDILPSDPYARVSWPSQCEMKEFADIIHEREPALRYSFIGFIDGFRLNIRNFNDFATQNGYYNGKYNSCVANLICFTPDGCVCWYKVNCPGSWGDGKLAAIFYRMVKNDEYLPPPYMILADQGFATIPGKIFCTRTRHPDILQKNAATSIRQAVEWGIGTIEHSWPRLQMPLRVDTKYNASLITLAIYLHNFKTRFTGINQTRTVFYSG